MPFLHGEAAERLQRKVAELETSQDELQAEQGTADDKQSCMTQYMIHTLITTTMLSVLVCGVMQDFDHQRELFLLGFGLRVCGFRAGPGFGLVG